MRLDEYLDTVSEQIRYKKIRSTVVKELENHINAQNELINQMENSNSWKLTKPLRNIRKR